MYENYTPEEERAISELRNRMKNELPPKIDEDKVSLYKFLKARNFNLEKAEVMLRNSLRFRKEIQIDKIASFKLPEVLLKYIAQSFLGFDKEGCPIWYIASGNTDLIGLFKCKNFWCLLKHGIQIYEQDTDLQKKQSEKLRKNISQSIQIYDMDKFSYAQATHRQSLLLLIRAIRIFQDNYPERLKRVYVINASLYFTVAWPLIKPFMSTALLEKFHFYGQSGWKEELLKCIDAEVLPAFLGGKRTDSDGNPECLTFVKHGGKVPERYYIVKDIEKTARKPGMKHLRLERQVSASIPIDIKKPASILNWEFEIKCYDIGFGLTVETLDEEKPEELIPIHKLETENEPLCESYRCEKAGKYSIVFDNSHSWLHSKVIYYRTWVTDSEDIE